MASRRADEQLRWTLHKYGRSPRIVSDRAARLPFEGTGIRQAVVRIRSRQSLTKLKNGQAVPGTGQEKDMLEYVVLQRRFLKGQEDPWLIWGTMEETTMDKVKAKATLST